MIWQKRCTFVPSFYDSPFMTFDEFRQLRAYARYDGIYLAVIWIASFASIVCYPAFPPLSMLCVLLMLSTPFFVAYRLRLYRQEALGDSISFGRALLYCLRVFFNAAFCFAIAQWAYMQYLDNGRLLTIIRTLVAEKTEQGVFEQLGMEPNIIVQAFEQVTPLEFACSYLIENILLGAVMSILLAIVMKKGLKN